MNKSIDLSYLEEITGGADFIIKEMLELFLSETPQQIELLKDKCNEKEWESVRAIAHKITPTFLYVGLQPTHEQIGLVEKYARNNEKLDLIPSLIDSVEKDFKKAEPEVVDLIKEFSS